jgi:hypothetical protein
MSHEGDFDAQTMLAETTELGRELYIGAIGALGALFDSEHVSHRNLALGFLGKPLPFVRANVWHVPGRQSVNLPNGLIKEVFWAVAMGVESGNEPAITGTTGLAESDSTLEKDRRAIRTAVSETVITEGIDVSDVVVPDTAFIGYEGSNAWQERIVNSDRWSEEIDVPSITAARRLAEASLQHLKQHGLEKNASGVVDDHGDIYKVNLSFIIGYDLPLNGYEPRPFLETFYENMLSRIERSRERLNFFQRIGASTLVEREESILDRASQAAETAQAFLKD